jgi:large subunit ribosomal protein L1
MGKVRKVALGDESFEKEQRKKAEVRREAKKFKKEKVEGVGLHGGERTAVVEGTELNAEVKELLEKVEGEASGEKPKKAKIKKPVGPKPRSKKYQDMAKLVDKNQTYPLQKAIDLVKKTSYTKFDGTVELHLNLNPMVLGEKKEKKDFRGSVTLPHGTGKQVRVIAADDAVLKDIEAGTINFDILVSHPSMMPKLAKVARILGPKGLMPNPKTGTVTEDVDKRIKELSHGQVNFKTEPENPIVHLIVGKVSFEDKQLLENVNTILDTIGRGKILKATMTATMGPGIRVEV